ncbi:outer membrane beta-barrel protein [Compostibacter hankyongensis]|uniref:TonB-dependent receptor n=1 Tax=Compostibacter hankyongensis TaxID=1007089 RepID=A0ABP8FIG2_9BACT
MRFLFTILIICCCCAGGYAQSVPAAKKGTVKGVVLDESGQQGLPYATIQLWRMADSAVAGGAHTMATGAFTVGGLPAGKYYLRVSYLGYQAMDTIVALSTGSLSADLGKVVLSTAARTLQSIDIVGNRPPMQVKGDTVSFNPTAYKTEPDETAEDLIAKIPALQTDDQGNIKSQGDNIVKVLVDGKPFYEGNSKDALKMIPASILDRIEVMNDPDMEYDASDPEKPRVLNLVIKKDQKRGHFVTAHGSAGNRGQAEGNGRVNLIRGESMTAIRGGGNKGVQDSYNYNLNPYYRNYVNEKFSYRVGLNYSHTQNESFGSTRKQNFFSDTSYFVNESSTSQGENNGYGLGGGFEYNPTKQMRIRFSQSFNLGRSENGSYNTYTYTDALDSLLTQGNRSNTAENKSGGANSSLNFIYRFKKPGRRLEANLAYNYNTGNNTSTIYALRHDLKAGTGTDTTDQTKLRETNNKGVDFRANYVTPFLSKNSSLNLGYHVSAGNNLNDNSSYDNEASGLVFDSVLSNQYRNHDYSHNLSADYAIHLNDFRYWGGVSYQYILTRGFNFLKDSNYVSTRYSLYPRAGVRYDFDEHNDIILHYSGSLRPPSFEQLQPTIDNTDPQHIRKGNPGLSPEFSSRIRLHFKRYNPVSMNSLSVRMAYNLNRNQIQNINSYDTTTGVVTTQPENIPSNYGLDGDVDYVVTLSDKSSINLHTDVSYNSFVQRYNQTDYSSSIDANTGNITLQQEMDGNLRLNGGFKFYINVKDILFLSGGMNVDYSTFTADVMLKDGSAPPSPDLQYYDLHSRLSSEIELPWDIKYGIYAGFSKQSNVSDNTLDGYNLLVLNSAITKRLFNKKGAISLRVNDITNSIAKRNAVIDPDFAKNSPFADLTRYYTLSFNYTINKLGGKWKKRIEEEQDRD